MNTSRLIALLGLSAALFAGCGPKRPTLHLYTWSDYLDPELVAAFEQAHGCRVKVDTFDSNETMYAKVLAGSGGYDVIFPSSYQISLMAQNNMLRPLDKAKLPNVTANFDPAYTGVILNPDMTYNVPYAVTFTGLAYRKDKTGGAAVDSWASLDNPVFKGRISLLNDFRETLGAALKSLGYSLNSTDPAELKQACEVVLRWKKNIAKFDNEQYKTGIASGEFLLGHGYSGDIAQVMLEDAENIGFAFPKEGFTAACDEMVIP
ncbi:MAG: spermidine/putrescine ABC transporter substrate-binding protein, partial [Kiritimatiellia bacterium]